MTSDSNGILAWLTSRRMRRRWVQHHLLMAVVSIALTYVITLFLESPDQNFELSMGTAYASLLLLVAGLFTGPLNVLLNRPNPVSTDLRRDFGIWAGIIGIAHVFFGLQVHMGNPLYYFLWPPGEGGRFPLRYDSFGIANYIGLAATLLLVLLLALSNDFSLRKLGRQRWKTLQRSNYFLFLFVAVHGVMYQFLLENRPQDARGVPFVLALGVLALFTLVVQLAGFRKRRQELQLKQQQATS